MVALKELSSRLVEWRHFEECLIHDFRWTNWTYSVEVTFDYVWDPAGRVRRDVDSEPLLVALRLKGVESLRFVGALTDGMKREPERINWGLSEVAGVSATERAGFLVIRIDWEGERHFEICCLTAELARKEI